MNAVDAKLKNILQQLNLGSAVMPANLDEERKAFLHPRLARRGRSPVFRYGNAPSRFNGLDTLLPLENIDAPGEVAEVYHEKQRELDATKKMFAAVGSDKFTPLAVELFDEPGAEDAVRAREVLANFPDAAVPERSISAGAFAEMLESRLKRLGIPMRVALISQMATRISVDAASGQIHLNRQGRFGPREARRLLVHEVDAHAVRIHNGSRVPWGVFAMGTSGYREAEEGLAVFFERQSGNLYPYQERIYAGRCLAVFLSLSAGFAEVFEELRAYFDEETAYALVERVKRGLSDTSRPGALTKEFHYFTGPAKVRSFLDKAGSLEMLMGGKIAFKHADVMAKLVRQGHVDTSKWVFPLEISDARESS